MCFFSIVVYNLRMRFSHAMFTQCRHDNVWNSSWSNKLLTVHNATECCTTRIIFSCILVWISSSKRIKKKIEHRTKKQKKPRTFTCCLHFSLRKYAWRRNGYSFVLANAWEGGSKMGGTGHIDNMHIFRSGSCLISSASFLLSIANALAKSMPSFHSMWCFNQPHSSGLHMRNDFDFVDYNKLVPYTIWHTHTHSHARTCKRLR